MSKDQSVASPSGAQDTSPALRTQFIPGPPRLAYDIAGKGEHVIFLHGVGGNRTNWKEQMAAFAPHFCAVAVDARGYGESDDYEGELSIRDYSEDVIRLLDYLQVEAAHIVGLSMGGNVALQCALDHPSRIRSLILCDTDRGMQHITADERSEFLRLRRDPLLSGEGVAKIAPALVESLAGPHATAAARSTLHESLLRLRKHMYIKSVKATVDFDVTGVVDRITCPTLVLVGEMDRLTPISEAQAICREIRGSSLVIIPRAGHLSNIEEPEAFNQATLTFLQAQSDFER